MSATNEIILSVCTALLGACLSWLAGGLLAKRSARKSLEEKDEVISRIENKIDKQTKFFKEYVDKNEALESYKKIITFLEDLPEMYTKPMLAQEYFKMNPNHLGLNYHGQDYFNALMREFENNTYIKNRGKMISNLINSIKLGYGTTYRVKQPVNGKLTLEDLNFVTLRGINQTGPLLEVIKAIIKDEKLEKMIQNHVSGDSFSRLSMPLPSAKYPGIYVATFHGLILVDARRSGKIIEGSALKNLEGKMTEVDRLHIELVSKIKK